MSAKLTYVYDLVPSISANLTVDQIMSTMIFGSAGIAGVYNPLHTYEAGDIVSYIDPYGTIHVLECINSGASGDPITIADWTEFSIYSRIQNTNSDLIVMAINQPTAKDNRIWLKYRGGSSYVPPNDAGVASNTSFMVSQNSNDYSSDLVWNSVTT